MEQQIFDRLVKILKYADSAEIYKKVDHVVRATCKIVATCESGEEFFRNDKQHVCAHISLNEMIVVAPDSNRSLHIYPKLKPEDDQPLQWSGVTNKHLPRPEWGSEAFMQNTVTKKASWIAGLDLN